MKKGFLVAVCIGTVLWTGFIFANSMQPAAVSTGQSDVFTNMLVSFFDMFHVKLSPETVSFGVRKTAHAVEFLIQSSLLTLAVILWERKLKSNIVPIWFVGLLTGCIDEYIQLFSVGRSSQVSDVFVDFFGTIVGTLIGLFIYWICTKKKKGRIYYRR